jgi:prefoldin alpha subunit
MNDLKKKRELQEKILRAELLQAHAQQVQDQLAVIISSLEQHTLTREAVKHLENIGVNKEILLPLGSGVYVYAKLSSIDKVLINVGASVLVHKKPSESLQIVDEKITKLTESRDKLQKSLLDIKENLNKLKPEIQQIYKEIKNV